MKANIQEIDQDDEIESAPANSNKKPKPGTVGGITPDQLKQYLERIEHLEQSKAAIAYDIREVYAEAKGSGFEPKIMRHIIRLRKMDPEQRQEQQELLDLYMHAVGME